MSNIINPGLGGELKGFFLLNIPFGVGLLSLCIYHRHVVNTEYTKQAGSHMKWEYMSAIWQNDPKRYNNGTRGG
jgi:hypothetical protein